MAATVRAIEMESLTFASETLFHQETKSDPELIKLLY